MARQGFVAWSDRYRADGSHIGANIAAGIIEHGEVTQCEWAGYVQPRSLGHSPAHMVSLELHLLRGQYIGPARYVQACAVSELTLTLATAHQDGTGWLHIQPVRLREPDEIPLRPGHMLEIAGRMAIIVAVGERCIRVGHPYPRLEIGQEIVRVRQMFEIGCEDETSIVHPIHDHALTR